MGDINMYDPYSIYKYEMCPICKGLKILESRNPKNGKIYHVACENCNGKGYLKILKSDYDY
jgi:transcription elongation factor Elf1